jgi:hypothetical protein
MTAEFLFFANLTLLLRTRLLLIDAPAGARAWWTKCAFELAMMAVVLRPGPGWAGALVLSVMATFAAIRADKRARDRNAMHLCIGVAQILGLSFCLSAAAAPEVRPALTDGLQMLRGATALGPSFSALFSLHGLKFLLGLLLVANEANLLIRLVLGRLQIKPGSAGAAIDANEYARGRVIGLLERTLIYFFVLNGQYGAVGFTLAAKGFTRFKELENRGFAEYVLIGTLLSSGLAMIIAVAVQSLR